jgi:hypothetical protein
MSTDTPYIYPVKQLPTYPTLTVGAFAALPPCWPEYVTEGAVLIARISPNNNRPSGDEDVLVRALVYVPDCELIDGPTIPGHLARLTIRGGQLEANAEAMRRETEPFMVQFCADRLAEYVNVLRAVLCLPVIELGRAS